MMDPVSVKALTMLLGPIAGSATKGMLEKRTDQALVSNSIVETLLNKFSAVISDADTRQLAERMAAREKAVKLRKQLNVEECLRLAIELALEEPAETKRPVDPDWFLRWFDAIEDVSDEYIQSMWARVLAREVDASQGGLSLRALDTLRLMGRAEAESLERFRLLSDRVGVLVVTSHEVVERTVGLDSLDALQDLSLVTAEDYRGSTVTLPDALSVVWAVKDGKVQADPFRLHRLSSRGKQLAATLPRMTDEGSDENAIDFTRTTAHLDYACLLASGFDDQYEVRLRFNPERYKNPEDPVAQRSRNFIITHRWDTETRRWRCLLDLDEIGFPAEAIGWLESGN